MRRVSSRNALRRSSSAPTLTPLWEPHDEVPAYLHSEPCKSAPRPRQPGESSVSGRDAGPAAGGPWNRVLIQWSVLEQQLLLSPAAASQQVDRAHLAMLTSAATTMEFMAAAHDSIRRDSQPMRLKAGLVEHHYAIKQLLCSGVSFKVRRSLQRSGRRRSPSLSVVGHSSAPALQRVHR